VLLSQRVVSIYDELTDAGTRRLRVEQLLDRAALAYPALVPSPDEVRAERGRGLRDQHGVEFAQGQFLAAVLAEPSIGTHLVESMLRPRPESLKRLPEYAESGRAGLGAARVERQGNMGVVTIERGDRLNAENDATTSALEAAVDLVLLDPRSEIGVLRGGIVDHRRYRGRRVFSSGLDLSELYAGKLSYLFFVLRELGFVAKMHRGMAAPDAEQVREPTVAPLAGDGWIEKPWLAGVDTFAIGGGAQLLLVMDAVVAAEDALLSLPASQEGIIPGAAALRLPAFVGVSAAHRSIMFGEQWRADGPEGRKLCDHVVAPDAVDDAIESVAGTLLAMGPTSVVANRRALRAAREPLDAFRRFMATYAIEQARCMGSAAVAGNLERTWVNRKPPT
jgi:thioesterase DpgC